GDRAEPWLLRRGYRVEAALFSVAEAEVLEGIKKVVQCVHRIRNAELEADVSIKMKIDRCPVKVVAGSGISRSASVSCTNGGALISTLLQPGGVSALLRENGFKPLKRLTPGAG